MTRTRKHLTAAGIVPMVATGYATCLVSLAFGQDIAPGIQQGPTVVTPGDSILSEYTNQAPPSPAPPRYTLLRFNENYRYLADPARRDDLFDPVKFIPLSDQDAGRYVSLGGELRERYEHYTEPGFGVGKNPKYDDYVLQRVTFAADFHVNDHVRFFTQGISGFDFGGERAKPPTNADPADLQQAFVDYKFFDDAAGDTDYVVTRAGRFEMTYGSGRLVATRAAPNIPFKFDGLQVIASEGGAKIYAFVTKPAREQPSRFDDEYPGQMFWGIYGETSTLGTPLNVQADVYYLGYKNEQASYATVKGRELRHTVGTRLHGKIDGFDYDIEPVIQFGTLANRDIRAWTFASSFGYTFDHAPWKPRVGTNFDVASGDAGKPGTASFGAFNPLYFKAGYFNDASLIRPTNIMDVHPTLELFPHDGILMTFGSDAIWRYSTHDAIYGPAGNLELSANQSSRYVAATAEASAQWQINRHISWILSYVHFFTGAYVASTHGRDVTFYGSWITFTW